MRGMCAVVGVLLVGCAPHAATVPAMPSSSKRVVNAWTRPATPSLSREELDDAEYIATLIQQGVPVDDRDQMILLGHTVCVYLGQEGTGVIDAAAGLMDDYGYPGGQAGDIAVSAVDVYCPEKSP